MRMCPTWLPWAGLLLGFVPVQPARTDDRPQAVVVGWRGDGTGRYPRANPPLEWSRPARGPAKNIAWMTRLPARSVASPIVVGDRVFVTSDRTDLLCLDRADGKVLWLRSNTYYHALTAEEKAQPSLRDTVAPLADKLTALNEGMVKAINAGIITEQHLAEKQAAERELSSALSRIDTKFAMPRDGNVHGDFGTSVPTPCSDGQYVYVWFGHGVAACYDLEGTLRWIRHEDQEAAPEHGYTVSPVLVDNTFIVMHRDISAFDARTGAVCWRQKLNARTGSYTGVYGSLAVHRSSRGAIVITASGNLLRVSDGKLLFAANWVDIYPTPIVEDGILYQCLSQKNLGTLRTTGPLLAFRVPDADTQLTKEAAEERFLPRIDKKSAAGLQVVASPLCFDKLLYVVDQRTVLRAFDLENGQRLYEKQLDPKGAIKAHTDPGLCSSPALAGGHVYILGDRGTVWVLEPGREFKLLAKNELVTPNEKKRQPELFLSGLEFSNKQIFVRGTEYLYCVGEK
jgi:outer membrane protein assembly factor BamB